MKQLTFCLALFALLIAGTIGAYRIIEVPEVGARTITMVMGGVAAAGCSTPVIGSLYTEGFEGSENCVSGDSAYCENSEDWTTVSGSPVYNATLPLTLSGVTCSRGFQTDIDESLIFSRLDYGSTKSDAKLIVYLYLASSTAGTDCNIISIGDSTTQGNARWAAVGLWNNSGTIKLRAYGGGTSSWLPTTGSLSTGKWYKIILNGKGTDAAAGVFSVQDCSSGTCTDVAGSPDTVWVPTIASGANFRYVFLGALTGGAGEITNIYWDALGIADYE